MSHSNDTVVVSKEWYEKVLDAFSGKYGCPFCGSMRQPMIDTANITGYSDRKGCLDCNKWWSGFLPK